MYCNCTIAVLLLTIDHLSYKCTLASGSSEMKGKVNCLFISVAIFNKLVCTVNWRQSIATATATATAVAKLVQAIFEPSRPARKKEKEKERERERGAPLGEVEHSTIATTTVVYLQPI